jgi:hypothetical protein
VVPRRELRAHWLDRRLLLDRPILTHLVILLSNRNHPTESGNVLPLRATIGTLAAESIPDFNFAGVPACAATTA